jgi:hypothetical protein
MKAEFLVLPNGGDSFRAMITITSKVPDVRIIPLADLAAGAGERPGGEDAPAPPPTFQSGI